MTKRGAGLMAAVAVTAAVAMTVAGCDVTTTRRAVDTAAILGEFASQLGGASRQRYTAEYSVAGADPVTLVHRPSATAYLTEEGRFIVTPDHLIRCAAAACYRAPNTDRADRTDPTGPADRTGFATPDAVLELVAAAAFAPRAKAKVSDRTIARQGATCADVTGTGGDFSVCVTGEGILASFRGRVDQGPATAIELIGFAATADPRAFSTPPGAQVIDVPSLPPR